MRKYLLSLAATILSVGMYAQNDSVFISFSDAYRITMADNPQIAALEFEERAAAEERKAAVGLRMPQIGVSGAYVHMGDRFGYYFNDLKAPVSNFIGQAAQTGLIPDNVLQQANSLLSKDWGLTILKQDFATVGGTVSLPIFTGGKINAANRAAQINEQAVIEKGDAEKNSLTSELVERYYGLKLAMQVVVVRRQVVEAMELHLRDAVALEENGIISRGERLLVEVKKSEADRELLSAELNVQNIRAALCNTLNYSADLVPSSQMFILNSLESYDYFRDIAMDNNPLLRQVSLQKDLAEQGVKLERSEYMPQIAALGGVSFYRYNLSDHVPNWAVGAGVKLNIFDGLQRERKVSAAKYKVRQVESLEIKAENDIAVLIENIYNEMQNVKARIPSIDKSLEFAEEYVRIQNVGFREGVVSATDVIDAELNLAATRVEKLSAAFTYDVLLSKLLEAAGISEQFLNYSNGYMANIISYEE